MELPSRDEQRRIITALSKRNNGNLVPNGEAYAVSLQWFKSWKKAVGYGIGSSGIMSTDIGPITNSDLIDKSTGLIRSDVVECIHYDVVTGDVWKKLFSWYEGGPAIPLQVIATREGKCKVPTKFKKVLTEYRGKRVELQIHNMFSSGDFCELVRRTFGIDPTEELRFLAASLYKTVRGLVSDFLAPPLILVDYKLPSGIWNDPYEPTHRVIHVVEREEVVVPVQRNATVGLENLGNTCFFNSAIQCLVHTKHLVSYFDQGRWTMDLNKTNPLGTQGKLSTEFASLVRKMYTTGERYVSPVELKDVVGTFAPQFSGHSQQDSHELLTFVLDGIHEDLNRCKDKPYVEGVNGDGTNDQELALHSQGLYKMRNDSIITDLFQGLLRSEMICPSCQKKTVVFDPYLCLSLPVHRPGFSLEVTFVSYDLQEFQKMKLKVLPGSDISTLVSEVIHKPVNVVVLGFKESSVSINYHFGIPECFIDSYCYYAIEIPDLHKKYVFGRIRSDRTDISCPIPIEVTEFSDSVEEMAKKFESRLPLEKGSPSKKFQEDQKPMKWDGSLVKVKLTDSYGFLPSGTGDDTISADETYDYIGNKVVHVFLNPEYVTESLFSHITNIKSLAHQDKSTKAKKRVTIDKCFEYFSENEVLDEDNEWFCPHCRNFVRAQKKMDIWNTAQILIIQLKRFVGGHGDILRKFDENIEFPDELDMSKYIIGPDSNRKYKLYAVSEHMGGISGGHYIAHVRTNDNQWYEFNDRFVNKARQSDAHTDAAYVLFYELC